MLNDPPWMQLPITQSAATTVLRTNVPVCLCTYAWVPRSRHGAVQEASLRGAYAFSCSRIHAHGHAYTHCLNRLSLEFLSMNFSAFWREAIGVHPRPSIHSLCQCLALSISSVTSLCAFPRLRTCEFDSECRSGQPDAPRRFSCGTLDPARSGPSAVGPCCHTWAKLLDPMLLQPSQHRLASSCAEPRPTDVFIFLSHPRFVICCDHRSSASSPSTEARSASSPAARSAWNGLLGRLSQRLPQQTAQSQLQPPRALIR